MKKMAWLLLGILLLTGCAQPVAVAATTEPKTTSATVTISGYLPPVEEPQTTRIQTITVEKEVPVIVYREIWREPRQFTDTDELADYLDRPVLMPTETQDCDDLARLFMLQALKDGYLVSQQFLPNWSGGPHMLNMAVIGNGLYYIEPATNKYWWVSPLD